MAIPNVTWVTEIIPKFIFPRRRLSILIATLTLFTCINGQDTKLNQIPEILNSATGFIKIERTLSSNQLSNSDMKAFKTMAKNLVSIGLVIEPKDVARSIIETIDEEALKKLTSERGFKLTIKPDCIESKCQTPRRPITETEGRKLREFLNKMNAGGFEVNILTF